MVSVSQDVTQKMAILLADLLRRPVGCVMGVELGQNQLLFSKAVCG